MALPKHHGEVVNPDGLRVSAASGSAIVADAGGHAPVMLPSGRFASDAEYLQQGDDLLLIGPDGTTVVVRDYFLTDAPPNLLTPEGGRITPEIVNAFTPPEAAGQIAQASTTVAAEAVGQVSSVSGKTYVVRTNGVREEVGAGDPIFQGDVIETADGGAIDILFVDQTTFALGGDARLAIDKLVYDPDTKEGTSSYSILKGMFVFSSGEIAKINPLDMTVKTTVATIGIRGTTVAGEVLPAGQQSKFTIIEGEIIVLTDAGYVVLSEANETTFVTGFDAPPTEAILYSQSEIDGFYSDVKGISNDYYEPASRQGNGEEGSGEGGSGEGRAQELGGEGEGDEPDLEQLAESLSDITPAAGGEGEGEGEGSAEGEGGALGVDVTLLRVDQNPFRTEPEQQFNLTENAGDELGGSGDGGGTGGGDGGGGSDGGGTTETTVTTTDEGGGSGEGDTSPEPGTGTGTDFSGSDTAVSFPGSDGDDQIIGSDFGDTLSGGAGDDTVRGGGGDDTLAGGAGDDTVEGGGGNDILEGGTGDDVLDGGEGNDTLQFTDATGDLTVDLTEGSANGAETNSDTIVGVENVVGGTGDDTLTGDGGDNSLDGGAGNDDIDGGGGDDFIEGGEGDDTLKGGSGNDVLRGGEGTDTAIFTDTAGDVTVDLTNDIAISAETGTDTIVGVENVKSGAGNDTLTGGDGDNTLDGGAGNDEIDGGAGGDGLSGGDGSDIIRGGAGDDGIAGGEGNDNIDGGDGDDFASGGAGDDVILGGLGDDGISGESGNDTIDGGAGADGIDGGAGNDTISGGAGDDNIVGKDGTDTLTGDEGRDTLDGGAGDDLLRGGDDDDVYRVAIGDGSDRIEDSSGEGDRVVIIGVSETLGEFGGTNRVGDDLVIALGDDQITIADHFAGDAVEAITFEFETGLEKTLVLGTGQTGGDADGVIVGGGGGEVLSGGGGDDVLIGGAGNDILQGGSGNDSFLVSGADDGFDRFNGGDGFDRVLGGDNDDVIGILRHSGEETVEQIDGGAGENIILGSQSNSILDFSGTALTNIARIEGAGGNDVITGSSGADTIVGGVGNDILKGESGDDVFLVSGTDKGFDRVTGGAGFDQILGGVDDDRIGFLSFSGETTVEAIDGGAGENVIEGSNSNNSLDFSGTTLTNIARIEGNGGNDVITGSLGDDTIVGGIGNDFLNGEAGDDIFLVSGTNEGFDRVSGGAGFDQVLGSEGDDNFGFFTFGGETTVEAIDGGTGENVIEGSKSNNALDFSGTVLTNIARIEGAGGNDVITGSSGNDVILGGSGNDLLRGGDGDDTLQGDAGRDRLFGDAGDDRLIVENDDFLMVDGGAGTDTVAIDFNLDLANVIDSRLANIESFDLRSGADATLTIGLNDVLAATDGANALTGGFEDLVIRRDSEDTVNVVGDTWDVSQDSIDTDGDGAAEGYTVFNDAASGATVYVENTQFA